MSKFPCLLNSPLVACLTFTIKCCLDYVLEQHGPTDNSDCNKMCCVRPACVCWMLMGQHSFQFLPIPSDSGSATGKYVHLFLLCTGPVWACLASTAWVVCQMTASSIEAELGETLSFFIYPFFFFFFTTYMCWDRAAPLYCCIRSNQIEVAAVLNS